MDRKSEILEVAKGLFAQFGVKKVTTDDIARSARISKATIYKHYRNKTEIFDEMVSIEARELLSAIRSAVDAEPTVVGKFRAHLLTRMEKTKELVNLYRLTQESWLDFRPHVAGLKEWFFNEEATIIRQIMQQGIDKGDLHIERLDLCAHISCIALQSIEFPWAFEEHGITASDYVDMMIDMMYNGIRKR